MALVPGDWTTGAVRVYPPEGMTDDQIKYHILHDLVAALVLNGPMSFPTNKWTRSEETP